MVGDNNMNEFKVSQCFTNHTIEEQNNLYLKYENEIIGVISRDYLVSFESYKNSLSKIYFGNKTVLNKSQFISFLSDRIISKNRRDIQTILARLGLPIYDTISIAKKTRAFSMSDKLWISYSRTEDYYTTFKSMFKDFFSNNVGEHGDSISSPSGCNVKRYVFNDDGSFGIAKERLNRNSTDHFNEVIVYKLSLLLGVNCCYASMISDTTVFSKYQYDFNKHSMVHARNFTNGESLSLDTYQTVIETYFKEFENNILKMILLDFITFQDDRHMSNWGMLVDYAGNKEFYALYDNGRCLLYEADENFSKEIITNPEVHSNSFGLVGTYLDIIKDIACNNKLSNLVNLNVTDEQVRHCFTELVGYPEWKIDYCTALIMWSLNILKSY